MTTTTPIKVLIPSYNRPTTARTHKYFSNAALWEPSILVHDNQELIKYAMAGVEPLINTRTHHTVTAQRQWALENCVSMGEWFIFADDNLDGVGAMQSATARDTPITQEEFFQRVQVLIQTAEAEGINLIGFATTDNPYFRQKRYGNIGFVLGKLKIVRRTDIDYDPAITMKEDYDFTAQHLLKDGKVLIDRSIRPKAKHFEAGGCGPRESRLEVYKTASRQLMAKYPGLFRSKKDGEEVQIIFHSPDQIAKWQYFMYSRH